MAEIHADVAQMKTEQIQLTKQLAALEEVRHQEAQRGSDVATKKQLAAVYVGIVVAGVIGLAGLVVSIMTLPNS